MSIAGMRVVRPLRLFFFRSGRAFSFLVLSRSRVRGATGAA